MDFSNITAETLIIALIFSGVGWVYFSFGRKQGEAAYIISGVLLMGYGYFITSVLWSLVTGLVLCFLPFALKRVGLF